MENGTQMKLNFHVEKDGEICIITDKDSVVKEFEELLKSTGRDGMDNLIDFIQKSDFYTAPASTRYHGSYESGLLVHSMNVYACLATKSQGGIWKDKLADIPKESIIISSLLHDLCKTYFYTTEMRNRKDENGKWISVPFYTIDNKIPYGHGEKSVMMIEEYIKLTPMERYAIRWHMGFSEPKESYNDLGAAFERYPLALALYEADLEATNLLEATK